MDKLDNVVSTLGFDEDGNVIIKFIIPRDIFPEFMHWLCNTESELVLCEKFTAEALAQALASLGAE